MEEAAGIEFSSLRLRTGSGEGLETSRAAEKQMPAERRGRERLGVSGTTRAQQTRPDLAITLHGAEKRTTAEEVSIANPDP